MRLAILGALLAATCNPPLPSPTPDPIPYPIPDGGGDDTSSTEPAPGIPQDPCNEAWAVMADAECPPAEGHEAWLVACAKLPSTTLRCVMTVESCAGMRECLETKP